jgi:cell wall-associated NlpC family hydrolase
MSPSMPKPQQPSIATTTKDPPSHQDYELQSVIQSVVQNALQSSIQNAMQNVVESATHSSEETMQSFVESAVRSSEVRIIALLRSNSSQPDLHAQLGSRFSIRRQKYCFQACLNG